MKQLDPERYTFIDGKTMSLEYANEVLTNAVRAMERTYLYFGKFEKSLNMQPGSFDQDLCEDKFYKGKSKREVIIIDEWADLYLQDKSKGKNKYNIEQKVIRLMQKARAAGIHIILATQRPDANVFSRSYSCKRSSVVSLFILPIN